jgi:hypothetical protein
VVNEARCGRAVRGGGPPHDEHQSARHCSFLTARGCSPKASAVFCLSVRLDPSRALYEAGWPCQVATRSLPLSLKSVSFTASQ